MGRIVVSEFMSLDGVAEAPGGDDNFVRGAWTFEFDRGPEGDQFKMDETVNTAAMLLGRRTYDGFAAAWPQREGDFADRFNAVPKYVVSSTLTSPSWANTTVLSGDAVDAIRKLKAEIAGDIVVHGSVSLVQTLVANDLVDELRIMLFPVVLGTGMKLFGDTADMKQFRLAESKIVGDGVAIMIFTPR
jgi:dihydrofolate reductase